MCIIYTINTNTDKNVEEVKQLLQGRNLRLHSSFMVAGKKFSVKKWLESSLQVPESFAMQGHKREHHVNFLQPRHRGLQHFLLPE